MQIDIRKKEDRNVLGKIEWLFCDSNRAQEKGCVLYDAEEDFITAVIAYSETHDSKDQIQEILSAEIFRSDGQGLNLEHTFSVYVDTDARDEFNNLIAVRLMIQAETVASLLMQIHNQLTHYYLADHLFYEGFGYYEGALMLQLGS